MTNSADPDQLASKEANWSGSTLCKGKVYAGSAWLGLKFLQTSCLRKPILVTFVKYILFVGIKLIWNPET